MMFKINNLIFIPSLVFGSIFSISSSSWFMAWMGLEINLMSMAPILINKMSQLSVEASIKYFLTQAIASSILVFFAIVHNYMVTNVLYFTMTISDVMMTCLMLKAGVAPLHFWFPQVLEKSEWFQCMLILTWQKLAPFVLVSFLLTSSFVWVFVVMSSIVGLMGGINQFNIKKIITYSSIIHSSWMLTIITVNEMIWWVYLTLYSVLIMAITPIFMMLNIDNLILINFLNMPNYQKIIIMINFLSIAGLPPFLGFFMKIMALTTLMMSQINLMIIFMLIISSFLAFYFYARIIYLTIFLNESMSNMKMMHTMHLNIISFMTLNIIIPLMAWISLPMIMVWLS